VFDGLSIGTGDNDTRKIKEWLEAGESVDEVLSGIEGPYVPLRPRITLLTKTADLHSSTFMFSHS